MAKAVATAATEAVVAAGAMVGTVEGMEVETGVAAGTAAAEGLREF